MVIAGTIGITIASAAPAMTESQVEPAVSALTSLVEEIAPDGSSLIPSIEKLEPEEVAEEAGLRYVSDVIPGIRRRRAGKGFVYFSPKGERLQDSKVLDRARKLAIPPAWTDVWIAPSANGHIQATGRDARGRKQYIYHPEWRRIRDETKYHRMLLFGECLPALRRKVDEDLSTRGISRKRVLATLVRLLDHTAIRVGNAQYARENESFGLTTLRADHVDVSGTELRLHFRGKGGKDIGLKVRDRRVTSMIRRLQELPGQELFRYINEHGQVCGVDSADVNEYLHEATGQPFTAKDFRTWTASVLAASVLAELGPSSSQTQLKRNINEACSVAASQLGNTKTICRNSYVHPEVFEAYAEGWLPGVWKQGIDAEAPENISPQEFALLVVLAHAESRRQTEALKAS